MASKKSSKTTVKEEPKMDAFESNIPYEWIVMDLGNANARMWCSGLTSPLSWRSIQGQLGHKTRYKKLPTEWAIKLRDGFHVFGEATYTECPDNLDDFPTTDRYTSEWYKQMFTFALYRAYLCRSNKDEPFEPTIVLSVPAKEYSNPGRKQKIEEMLLGIYKLNTVDDEEVEIDVTDQNLNIVPEGLGAFLFTSSQEVNSKLEKGLWIVLDLGYLTGDYTEYYNGVYVTDSADSSDKLGMINVSTHVAQYVRGQGGPDLDAFMIDPVVNKSVIEISGKSYPIDEAYHVAMTELGKRIMKWVERKSAGKNIAGILLTGGNIDKQSGYIAFSIPTVLCPSGEFGNLFGAQLMLQA